MFFKKSKYTFRYLNRSKMDKLTLLIKQLEVYFENENNKTLVLGGATFLVVLASW